MIEFREINEENFSQLLKIQVHDYQEKFVAPVVRSLADCWLYRKDNDCFPYAIYYDNNLIGFILICIDEREYYIWRLIIDKVYQNKGYGTKVMKYIFDIVQNDNNIDYILTDYVLGNDKMKKLLINFGFQKHKFYEEWNQQAMIFYKERGKNDNN